MWEIYGGGPVYIQYLLFKDDMSANSIDWMIREKGWEKEREIAIFNIFHIYSYFLVLFAIMKQTKCNKFWLMKVPRDLLSILLISSINIKAIYLFI